MKVIIAGSRLFVPTYSDVLILDKYKKPTKLTIEESKKLFNHKLAYIARKLNPKISLNHKELQVVALAVLDNGKIDGYDGLDKQMNKKDINTYTDIIGIS
jgi:hypothetical protein